MSTAFALKGQVFPSYEFSTIYSRTVCQNIAKDAIELAKEAREVAKTTQETFQRCVKTFFAETTVTTGIVLLAVRCQMLPVMATWMPIIAGTIAGLALIQVVTVVITVYVNVLQKRHLARAQNLEGIAVQANARAAELPSWWDSSAGLFTGLGSRFLSSGNSIHSIHNRPVREMGDCAMLCDCLAKMVFAVAVGALVTAVGFIAIKEGGKG